ncbi:hypothetical protein, partial [uncultured Campylobacter sp.]|uniref:hypothetical protein n=1 Tax=uncultured Campylobacter sp. TaxID=218934 RepID=UPI00262B7BE5
MSRNFIFNARKQGGSAQNLNLRCGLGADERSFGAYHDPVAFGHEHLPGSRCDDLSAHIDGLFRGIGRYYLDARGRELLRGSGCINVGAGRHSLSQDTGHCGFITPKYELRSRANCDYSVNVLLNGAAYCGFAARNSAKFSGDTYCSSSASTYLRRSSSVGACLRCVDANRDVHSRRDPSAIARLRRSSSASGRLQRTSDYLTRAACLRYGFNECGFSAKRSTQKTILGACCSPLSGAGRLGSEQNPALGTFYAVRNFLNLHVARDFNNFGSVNLKKFDLAALQFANLKKQIRAGEGVDKSAEPHNLTSFGREAPTPR